MAHGCVAIHLNVNRECRTFLRRCVSALAEYRIFMWHPLRTAHEPSDVEGVPNLRGVCSGKRSRLQQCHTQNRMQRVVGASSLLDRFQSKAEFTMNTYIAIIGGKAVLTFRAVDEDQAHAMIDDQEGSMRSDLKVLVDADRKPLWDGKSAIEVRDATAAEHAEWKRSRDQAISDGEIDLDARDDPDNWNVYLMGAPKNKVRRNG
jgi:hypothetical protein